jgi:signal transduction histidine kinase
MPRAEDVRFAARRPLVRWAAFGALTLLVASLAWWRLAAPPVDVATDRAVPSAAAAPDSSAALLATALGAALAGLFLVRLQRRANEGRRAGVELQALADLLDVWQWQTDARHRLVATRPPAGAPAADWADAAEPRLLWEHFRADDAAALQARMKSGASLHDVAIWRTAANGDVRPGRLRGRALTDANGTFAGYIGTLRDGLEASGERPSAGAAAVVERLPTASAASAGSAGRAAVPTAAPPMDNVSEHETFGYTVSHDLRAPIRVVEGFTKIVKEDYGSVLDRVGHDHLDRVLGAAARMNSMIDALLALSRLSSQPLAHQPVNLSQLAGFVADDLRREWPQRAVTFEVASDMLVLGDPTLLRMVLENLLGNAWKYTSQTESPRISFERSPGEPATYTVADNGAGFDMRFADRLFGVFQRLHSASEFPGTGVGLASVRRIIRRHGGEIWAEAEIDRGARFHFTLPQGGAARN